jgi:hypothetical protein
MPISDPGNAGTAGEDTHKEFERMTRRIDPEARQRASSLAGGIITAVALLTGFLVGVSVRDPLAVVAVAVAWLSAMIAASSVVTYRYGPAPSRPKRNTK